MRSGLLSRRNVVFGTAGLAAAVGYGASKLAGTVVRRGMPIDRLMPGKAVSGSVGFGLSGAAGARDALASRRGAPFLLHVWATWCPPCRHELPGLAAFMKAWGADCPVIPVAVSSGSPDDIQAFLTRNDVVGLPAWTVTGEDLKMLSGNGALAIPVTFLIDNAGRVRATAAGSLDWAGPGAADAVRRVLAATTASAAP
ncbi:TlpA family protein disulfide reductase [Gluconobacter sp. Dm-62]|uniref:TlpA family protein disulfide reductase n=1 Tax=Gluconobacter sp. Dm-62 TaxID=2799804 RepID=UPI001B8D06FF|nr:TlpA family protein disulfide reductase [Gluconobacter sp. Dm-62]